MNYEVIRGAVASQVEGLLNDRFDLVDKGDSLQTELGIYDDTGTKWAIRLILRKIKGPTRPK